LAAELQSGEAGWQKGAKELEALFGSGPDAEFVRAVEDGLRNLSDYTKLGQSGMASRLSVAGSTHIERSKSIRQRVIQAIDSLRPAAQRPGEPLPREWHSYVILHDAYVEDVPNREIMARLYISEGTFNRVRRKAIRAVARSLLEIQDQVGAA
jgi:predicted DNA-binding protein (UPF0251 family)